MKGGIKGTCFNCNKMAGHLSRYCPEPKADEVSDMPNINNLMLNLVDFDKDELEITPHVVNNQKYMNMLGNTGVQGHVAPAMKEHKNKTIMKNLGTIHMANGAKAKIYQSDNTRTIIDVNGLTVSLNN